MYFSEFMVQMGGAVIVTFVFMMIGEKLILLLIPANIHPLYTIVGSFLFAIILISIIVLGFSMETGIHIYLLSGVIILLNKYWFSQCSKEKVSR